MSYASPNVVPSGTTFAAISGGRRLRALERLITANSGVTANPTAAATLSANAGGTVAGLLAPGVYYVNFTEIRRLGRNNRLGRVGAHHRRPTVAADRRAHGRRVRYRRNIAGRRVQGQIHLC